MSRQSAPRRGKPPSAGAGGAQRQRTVKGRPAPKIDGAATEEALAHHRAGRLREAEALYRAVLRHMPKQKLALLNLSGLLRGGGRLAEARELAERAVVAYPQDPQAHFALGTALRQLRRDRDAIAAYEKALELDPKMIKAWVNLAVSSERIDRPRSIAAVRKALSAEPGNLVALNLEIKYNLQDCDFDRAEATTRRLVEIFEHKLDSLDDWRVLANLAYRALFIPIPPDRVQLLTRRIDQVQLRALEEVGRLPPLPQPDPAAAKRRLRIGYLTPNLADHPVGHVTLQLFPAHDRQRFEVHAFCAQGRRGGDPSYNKRHRHGVDFYHDLAGLSYFDMARRIRNLGIDVLVDLDGYMETSSTAIMVFRPAPVQVYWLGHAGGLGLSFVDYLIGDHVVIPPGEERLYREAIIRLPECYHVASRATIAEATPSRADCGLPQEGFVFAAFNNPEKINRRIFEAWAKILERVPGSVLWLSKVRNVESEADNLRRMAVQHGLDPGRLVFAERLLDKAAHLARHRHIGLFLDTVTLNASTTALDALWAGVPLLSVRGDRFQSRISNTMLLAAGLGDMIMENLDRYVDRAVHLATHPGELAEIARRLAGARESSALFKVDRFARHLEAAFETAWGRYCRGEAPREFDVPALPAGETAAAIASAPAAAVGLLQLHLEGREEREGWKIVAASPASHVDVVSDPRSLVEFANDSVDAIYAAWFYQRLGFRDELPAALAAAVRVLKPGGTLRLSVPDFQLLCNIMANPEVPKQEKFSIMAAIFGDQSTPERFSRVGLTAEFAAAFLKRAGFRFARRVPSFGLFDDMSSAKRVGRAISLNIEATK